MKTFAQLRKSYDSLAILPLKIEAIAPTSREMLALKRKIEEEDIGRKKLLEILVAPGATQITDKHPRFIEWLTGAAKLRETEVDYSPQLQIAMSDIELNRAPAGIQEHIAQLAFEGYINLDEKK